MQLMKLTQRGIAHYIILAIVVVVVAVGGTAYLVAVHANTLTTTPTITNTAVIKVFNQWQCPPQNKLSVDTYPGSTYPVDLCDAQQSSILDPYSFSNRDCGSYVAWMVTQENEQFADKSVLGLPGFWGRNIPAHIPGAKIVSVPRAGDIAIRPSISGFTPNGQVDVGHAMYIVSGDWNGSPPGQQDLVVKYYSSENGEFSDAIWAPKGDILYNNNGTITDYPFHLVYIQLPPLTSEPAGAW